MKYRKDFVTNSSSSSFVCEICGNTKSGFDLCIDYCDMFECENGHVLCQEHMLDVPREDKINEILKNTYYNPDTREYDLSYSREELGRMNDSELFEILLGENYYDVPECFCPICKFYEYGNVDMARYLRSEYKIPKSEVFKKIKSLNKRRRKLYDFEYIAYVASKCGVDLAEIQASWREKYDSYRDFEKSLSKEYLYEDLDD